MFEPKFNDAVPNTRTLISRSPYHLFVRFVNRTHKRILSLEKAPFVQCVAVFYSYNSFPCMSYDLKSLSSIVTHKICLIIYDGDGLQSAHRNQLRMRLCLLYRCFCHVVCFPVFYVPRIDSFTLSSSTVWYT